MPKYSALTRLTIDENFNFYRKSDSMRVVPEKFVKMKCLDSKIEKLTDESVAELLNGESGKANAYYLGHQTLVIAKGTFSSDKAVVTPILLLKIPEYQRDLRK